MHSKSSSRFRIVFMGTPAFAVPSFEAISQSEELIAVVTPPDRPSGRGMTLTPPPIKVAALKQSLPVYQTDRLRKDALLIKTLSDLAPDFIIVVAFGQILPASVLTIPRLGCINVHASLLPKFRGASPIQSAIIAGEKKTGVTTMLMDEGLDTGAILLQQSTPIDPHETAETVSVQLSHLGARLLTETVTRFKTSPPIRPIPQKGEEATITTLLKKEDGFIRWQESAEAIFNRWRGVFPWPGTTAVYREESWKITSLKIGASGERWGEPGETLALSDKGLEVAAGIGYIVVEKIRLPGGRDMSPWEYMAGQSISKTFKFQTKEIE
jgi:methionyl-tRNA formyltransferase